MKKETISIKLKIDIYNNNWASAESLFHTIKRLNELFNDIKIEIFKTRTDGGKNESKRKIKKNFSKFRI